MIQEDRSRLRALAQKYAEYALGEAMAKRREKWRLHNRMQQKTFPFHVEDNGRYLLDLTPQTECSDPICVELESRLLRAIVSYETIPDDRIISDRFVVDWVTSVTPYCDELEFTHAIDSQGRDLGYSSNKPVKDIDGDFGKLRRREISLDRPGTERRAELAADVFEGLLDVEVGRPSTHYSDGIGSRAVHLLGMQELYLQMVADPEAVHRLISFLAQDNIDLGDWEEANGLLTSNTDGNQGYCSGSSQYTDEIPVPEIAEGEVMRSEDRYGYLEAQEMAGVSPDMFGEFFMPHFRKLAAKFRLMKFGCCEPVHPIISHLQELPALRKVSVSPWCNLEALAEKCRPDIIWSRKPVPLKLCDTQFDPEDFRNHLKETMEIGSGHYIEFIFRDTNRLVGAMRDRVAEACRIVRELTE